MYRFVLPQGLFISNEGEWGVGRGGRDCLLFFHIAEAGQNQGVSWGVASASPPSAVLCLAVSNSCCCCHCSFCCCCHCSSWLCWRFKYAAHRLNLNFKCRTANNMLCVVIKCQLHKNNTPFAGKLHINRAPKSGQERVERVHNCQS